MTIRAKLYAAIVLTVLGPAGDDGGRPARDGAAGRQLRRGAARGAESRVGRPRAQVPGHGRQRLADRLRLRRRRVPGALRRLRGRAARRARPGRGHASPTSASGRCSDELDAEFEAFMALDEVAWRSLQAVDSERDASGSCSAPSCGASRRWPPRPTSSPTYEAGAGGGHRRRLRRRARRRPPAPDRRRAGRRPRDHPAAGHGQRHRPHGARGRARRARRPQAPEAADDGRS